MIPNLSREEVFTALWALTENVEWNVAPDSDPPIMRTFVTRGRRVKLFNEVSAENQPAIYQAEHAEQIAQKTNLPYRRIFEAKWIIYQKTGADKTVDGVIENNRILDALQAKMQPLVADPGYPQRNTLGGLVWHTFWEGVIFKDPGDIDDQAMMVIPLKVLVP